MAEQKQPEGQPRKRQRADRPKRTRKPEVVRRRRPGYKLVNGGWRRDPKG